MQLTIISPEKEIFKGIVTSVTVPGVLGEFQILDNHAAIVSALRDGDVKYILSSGEERFLSIGKGFVEVLNNEVSVLVQNIKVEGEDGI